MLVKSATGIRSYDVGCWVINSPSGSHVLVNQEGAELYRILRQSANFKQALDAFNLAFHAALSAEEFGRIVWARFGAFGILQDDDQVEQQPDYVAGATQLLPARVAGWLARPLVPLMQHRWYWSILGLQAAYVGLAAALIPLPSEPASMYLVAAPLVGASWVVHELGHIAACEAAGINHGGIGVGLYAYLFPVLYADVTNSWQASRAARLRINAGGIVAQVTLASLLTTGYLLTRLPAIQLASVGILVSAAWQINPFLRSDGYWMLSDLTYTPNLHSKASTAARRFFAFSALRQWLSDRTKGPTRAEVLLGVYGMLNQLVLLAAAAWMLSRHGQAILALPQQLPELLQQAWMLHRWPQPQQWVALGFYAMWGRYLVAQLVKRRRSTASSVPL
jgi:putative peptide zinc metalloprotease protein